MKLKLLAFSQFWQDFERRTKNLFWCEFRRNVGLLIRLSLVRAQVREPNSIIKTS